MSKKKKTPKTKYVDIQKFEQLRIDWKDHFTTSQGWTTLGSLDHSPQRVVSTGIKVYEDKEVVTLASNMDQNMKVADTTTILKNCIIKRTKLGVVEYGKKA